jgi:predicted O-methyltransferase YrrM
MPHYLVYTGTREGTWSINSRAFPGQKLRVQADVPFRVEDKDLWVASLRDMLVLSTVDFVPTTVRKHGHGDPTYCSPWEAAFLEGLAANCPDPARVVEIGTGKGTSLLRILYGLSLHEDARVWSIDLLEKEDVREALQESQVPNWRYTLVVGDSADLGRAKWEPLDLVFVDGSHSYEGVKADVEAWTPHLKQEGVFVFHDYKNRRHKVTKAVDETMANPWCIVGRVGSLAAFTREP